MIRTLLFVVSIVFGVITTAIAEVKNFTPVTQEMLLNPSPDDWLMLSRTYDQQRFSPLKQINRRNVGQLRMAWARGMGAGITESVPIVYQGVMYVVAPGAVIQALDASSGDLIWEYRRKLRRFEPDMQKPHSSAKLDDSHVKGHFDDHGHPVLQEYEQRLAKFGPGARMMREEKVRAERETIASDQ